jgi:hypothetical protein
LWQNRFFSCPLEDAYTWAALAYVERNAVCAGMVAQCEEWAWSSARRHLGRTDWCDWLAVKEWSQNWTPALWRVALQEGLTGWNFGELRNFRDFGDGEIWYEAASCGTFLINRQISTRRRRLSGAPHHAAWR